MAHNSEAVRFIRSISGIIERIPYDTPITESERIFINPTEIDAVPQYLKSNFKIVVRYKDNVPFKAACIIYSPKSAVTVMIIINKRFELLFQQFIDQFPGNVFLSVTCERRAIYVHETCHLAAVIKLFPENYDNNTRKKFVAAVEAKFGNELEGGQFFMHFDDSTPYNFDDNHFQFAGDKLDYHVLFAELMFSNKKIKEVVAKLFNTEIRTKLKGISTYFWIPLLAHIAQGFFVVFNYKKDEFNKEIDSYRKAA